MRRLPLRDFVVAIANLVHSSRDQTDQEDVRRRKGKEAEERAHGRRTRGRGKAPTTRWLMTGERGRHGDEASKEDDDHDGEHAETTVNTPKRR